jgi:tripartite ATP-independent transporter DctP family solute receptor
MGQEVGMKKFKRLLGLVCLIGFFALTGGLSEAAEIILRYAGNLPVDHHVTRGQELLAKLVEQKTGGKVKIQVFPAGQLFSDKDMMKAVPAGAVDMAEVTLSQWTGIVPNLLLLDLPLFFNDRRHVWRTVDGKVGEVLAQDLDKAEVKLLYWMDYGMADFISKQPLRTLEDFKGKRIRGYGELITESIRGLGGAPTFLGAGEVYMALQRGTIDGAASGTTSFYERKLYEVTKHVTHADYAFVMFGVLMNLRKWNELPPDIQKVFLACSKEAEEWGRKECEKMDKESLELLKQKGMEVYVVPEKEKERWKKASQPAVDRFLKRAGDRGKALLEMTEKIR